MDRPRIGIIIEDTDGYETVLRAFENPTLQELCTAVVYGDKDEALKCRKAVDLQTNFLCIQSLDEVTDNRLNLYQLTSGNGNGIPAETVSAQASEEKSLDALVVCSGQENLKADGCGVLFAEDVCVRVADKLDVAVLQDFSLMLERDFSRISPFVAILADDRQDVDTLLGQMEEAKLINYGVYSFDEFFNAEVYKCFDGAVTMQKRQAEEWFKKMSEGYGVQSVTTSGKPVLYTTHTLASDRDTAVSDLCHAIYTATDTVRYRQEYDTAHTNPLQKLFRDKREDDRKNVE